MSGDGEGWGTNLLLRRLWGGVGWDVGSGGVSDRGLEWSARGKRPGRGPAGDNTPPPMILAQRRTGRTDTLAIHRSCNQTNVNGIRSVFGPISQSANRPSSCQAYPGPTPNLRAPRPAHDLPATAATTSHVPAEGLPVEKQCKAHQPTSHEVKGCTRLFRIVRGRDRGRTLAGLAAPLRATSGNGQEQGGCRLTIGSSADQEG